MKFFIIIFIVITQSAMSQILPSSSRSKTAITNLTPQLEINFKKIGLTLGKPIYIRIFKEEAQLEIWVKKDTGFKLFNTYQICTYGSGGLGPKLMEGDGKAPEGFYFVNANQMNPYSSYHLSFNLGYPNAYDRAHNRTGSALMVHGDCVSVGCYAMTDNKIEEIYTIANIALSKGQNFFRVHVFPFRMTEENMNKVKYSQWLRFWKNLKQGYDFFDKNGHNPPDVTVENLRYQFH